MGARARVVVIVVIVLIAIVVLPIRVALLASIAVLGALLPLSAALRELHDPRDAFPLNIDTSYRKDDRFFAAAFEAHLVYAAGHDRPPGVYRFDAARNFTTIDGPAQIRSTPPTIVDVRGDATIAAGIKVVEEVFAAGDLAIGNHAQVAKAMARGTIRIGPYVTIEQWIDAGETLRVAAGTHLGQRATAGRSIELEPGVTFERLSAPRVEVAGTSSSHPQDLSVTGRDVVEFSPRAHRIRGDGALIVDGPFDLAAGAVADGIVIARGAVRVGEGAILRGSIHGDADVVLEPRSTVTGSVYAGNDLLIDEFARVLQHAIAGGNARLRSGASVGTDGRITTLLADGEIQLSEGVTVFGRILTARRGTAVGTLQ